jgi:hypothetical protein
MKTLFRLLVLASIAAGWVWGQGARDAGSIARSKALLHSANWLDKAWGAYFSTGLHSEELSDALIEELRLAAPLRYSTGDPESAYVQSLLDALIQSGKVVPTDALLPFAQQRRPEALILLARGGGNEETLLDLRKEKLNQEEWLLVSNLLLHMHSGRFFASILQEKTITHDFEIYDADGIGGGDEIGGGVGGGSGGGAFRDSVLQFPKGFPPVGKYQLILYPQAGDVVAAEGPKIVYYHRTVMAGPIFWGNSSLAWQPETRLMEYLVAIGGPYARGVFGQADIFQWQGAGHAESLMKTRLQAQVEAIKGFIKTAEEGGWSGASGLCLRVTPVVHDNRREAHEALPAVAAVEFTLE